MKQGRQPTLHAHLSPPPAEANAVVDLTQILEDNKTEANTVNTKLHATASTASRSTLPMIPYEAGTAVMFDRDVFHNAPGNYGAVSNTLVVTRGTQGEVCQVLQEEGGKFLMIRVSDDQEQAPIKVLATADILHSITAGTEKATNKPPAIPAGEEAPKAPNEEQHIQPRQPLPAAAPAEQEAPQPTQPTKEPYVDNPGASQAVCEVEQPHGQQPQHPPPAPGAAAAQEEAPPPQKRIDEPNVNRFVPPSTTDSRTVCLFDANRNYQMNQHAQYKQHQWGVHSLMMKQDDFKLAVEGWNFRWENPTLSKRAKRVQ